MLRNPLKIIHGMKTYKHTFSFFESIKIKAGFGYHDFFYIIQCSVIGQIIK